MINTYDHPDANLLIPSVRDALPNISRILARARTEGVPIIYANNNFGEWRSHHGEIIEKSLAGDHDLADAALRMMERNMGATITTANGVAF
ncbi:hypothetical protein [Streptomyces rubiginosohelvolus]